MPVTFNNIMNPFPVSTAAAGLFEEICRHVPRLELTFASRRRCPALERLERLSDADLLGSKVADERLAACVRAGLLLRADRMEESHAISQSIETLEGSYWHGILHRREPDYTNAKYWFRRVEDHPVFAYIAKAPLAGASHPGSVFLEITGGGRWDPFRFIDLCAAAPPGSPRAELEDLQMREIIVLLKHCAEGAAGRLPTRGGIAS